MSAPKTVAEMAGEFFREAAVLVVVFYPLEELLSTRRPGPWYIGIVFGVSCFLGSLGVVLETRRRP